MVKSSILNDGGSESEFVACLFDLSLHDAAMATGVTVSKLRRVNMKMGNTTWPFCTIRDGSSRQYNWFNVYHLRRDRMSRASPEARARLERAALRASLNRVIHDTQASQTRPRSFAPVSVPVECLVEASTLEPLPAELPPMGEAIFEF